MAEEDDSRWEVCTETGVVGGQCNWECRYVRGMTKGGVLQHEDALGWRTQFVSSDGVFQGTIVFSFSHTVRRIDGARNWASGVNT